MSIKVKGFLKDVGGASRVTKLREENFANGSPIPDPKDPIREVADLLQEFRDLLVGQQVGAAVDLVQDGRLEGEGLASGRDGAEAAVLAGLVLAEALVGHDGGGL